MKILFLVILVLEEINVQGQFRSLPPLDSYTFNQPILATSKKTFIPGLVSDPSRYYKSLTPMMSTASSYDWRMQNNFFWTGSVTTMSYNKGRFGTDFFWDVQGNLRSARGFIDISGKNKRGFKLVFPWKMFR